MSDMYLEQLDTPKTLFMTKSGLDKLKEKLDAIVRERLEAVKRIHALDPEEKTDPIALADEIRRIEANEIEATRISNLLQYVEPITKQGVVHEVGLGSEVTLRYGKKQVTYTIVCTLEVDIEANKISDESPLGRALLGKKIRDTVTVPTRKGEQRTYEIIKIQ